MSSLIPYAASIYNKNVSDLALSWVSNTTLTLGTGYCLDSAGGTVMRVGSAITINAAVNGVNGLDTGTFAASKEYYVFVIAKSTDASVVSQSDISKPAAALLSLSATAPYMPEGYDLFRRVGVVKTDGSVYFLLFWQSGKETERTYEWDEPISILSGGTSATLAALDCSAACMLADNQKVTIQAAFTPNAANDIATILPGTSSASTGKTISGNVAAKVSTAFVETTAQIASAVPKVKYKVTASGALTLAITSFIDRI